MNLNLSRSSEAKYCILIGRGDYRTDDGDVYRATHIDVNRNVQGEFYKRSIFVADERIYGAMSWQSINWNISI